MLKAPKVVKQLLLGFGDASTLLGERNTSASCCLALGGERRGGSGLLCRKFADVDDLRLSQNGHSGGRYGCAGLVSIHAIIASMTSVSDKP